ncbi:MAG: NfeD family protein [Sphingobacteriaceae bacterium]
MRRAILYFLFLFVLPLTLHAQHVLSIKVDGAINQVSASFIRDAIEKANVDKAQCLIIELNTPGGLLTSTRTIVSDMLASPVPVVVYVSPSGAHAGSAGVFLTLAAHVAAMSPGTNIGAAHPVMLNVKPDSIMNLKVTNDAAAFIRSIAEKRNRNLQWAEKAVRNSISITENQALQDNVIDFVAADKKELLTLIDGRNIVLATRNVQLNTKNARVENLEMSFSEKILDLISDPNVAYVLMLIGILSILVEFFTPGAILPGIVGVICLILAFYAMQTLPVNYAGLALIIFAVVLFILEIQIISHGVLAIGGIVSLTFGSILLFRSSSSLDMIGISTSVIVLTVIIVAAFFISVIGWGLSAQRLKPATGTNILIGRLGESLDELSPLGQVEINGEVWNAVSVSGPIKQGEKVRIIAVNGLTLSIEKVNNG